MKNCCLYDDCIKKKYKYQVYIRSTEERRDYHTAPMEITGSPTARKKVNIDEAERGDAVVYQRSKGET